MRCVDFCGCYSSRKLVPNFGRISYGLGQRLMLWSFVTSLQYDYKDDSMACHMMRWVDWIGLMLSFVTSLQDESSRRQLTPFWERIFISDIYPKISTWIRGPGIVVDSFHESSEMSAWLGQRHHYFDEISLLFETTQQSLGPRYVVWNVGELSRITRLYQNNDNVVRVLRRLVAKMGWVADGWMNLRW
jgi:hypothetical protein